MAESLAQSDVQQCTCCPGGFHLHLDFVKFAEDQLSVDKNKGIKVLYTRKNGSAAECSSRTSSNSLIYEKAKNFMGNHSEIINTNLSDYPSKPKHVKKESRLIQQKILSLQNSIPKTDEEIYGAELLEAIKDFDKFVTKTWGNCRSSKEHVLELLPISASSFSTSHQTPDSIKASSNPRKTIWFNDVIAENQSAHNMKVDRSTSNAALEKYKEDDASSLSKYTRPTKTEDKATCKSSCCESCTKAVNTEFTSHNTIATNTAIPDSAAVTRSAKLTIRTQNPVSRQMDCGCDGEGGMSSPINETRKDNLKSEQLEKLSEIPLVLENETKSASVQKDDTNNQSYDCSHCPSEDMKVGLQLVNEALLLGRTGRNVAASLAVVKNEWFQIVGITNCNVRDIENYLNVFSSYSPQLLRYMVNIPDTSGITALHYAVSYGNFKVVSKLLETNVAEPNKANKAGYTSIMLASLPEIKTDEEENIIRKLISLGDVDIKAAQHGQTALMLAASSGHFRMVKLLLEAGAKVDAQDEDGSTALMCAAEHGHADVVQCLLAKPECNPNLKDNDGLTALNVALEAGHKDIAVLLYAHMHFTLKPQSSTEVIGDNLVVSKRSRSTANTFCSQSFFKDQDTTSEVGVVARKQNSSIN